MKQKGYNIEVIEELLMGESHARAIAKAIGTNHMTVSRRLDELLKENVVDFKMEGRNKVFFLKKTLEAREHVFAAERNKLLSIIKKHGNLRYIIESVQNNRNIAMALIFGSYAKGLEEKDSDLDIYIETSNKDVKESVEKLDPKISVKIGKYDRSNLLIKEIEKNHVVIKGVERFYEKNGVFS